MIKKWIFFLLASSAGHAETFNELWVQASEENQELQSAFFDWQAAEAKTGFAGVLPRPEISYSHFIREVETRVGPQKNKFGLMQMIPWIPRLLLSKKAATKEAELFKCLYIQKQIELWEKVASKLALLEFLKKKNRFQKENLLFLDMLEEIAQSKVRGGADSADALEAQIEILSLQEEIKATGEEIEAAKSDLNALLGRDAFCNLTFEGDLFKEVQEGIPEQFDRSAVLSNNPQGLVLQRMIEVSEAKRKTAVQERFPDIAVGVDYVETGRSKMPVHESGKDPIMAMIKVEIPLWQRADSKKVRMYRQKRCSAEAKYDDHLKKTDALLTRILLKHQKAGRDIALYEKNLIPQAQKTLKIVREGYEGGRLDLERYVSLQKKLLKYQLALYEAIYRFQTSAFEFKALAGAVE